MPRPMTRPSAARPSAGPARTGGSQRTQQSNEELNALPDFVDEGSNISLDPANASDGGIGAGEGTTVTIAKARFGKFQYIDREKNVLDYPPELALFLTLQRENQDVPTREENLKFANWAMFAPTKDGNFVRPRPQVMKDRTNPPMPYKYNQGVLFMQSLKDSGFAIERIEKEGIAAIVGLTVHVRRRKVSGQGDNAKPALLVDYIGEAAVTAAPPEAKPAGRASRTGSSPVIATATSVVPVRVTEAVPQNSEVSGLAEEAMLDILGAADRNSISRAQIPTTLIRIPKWQGHDNRGAILKLLRDDSFISRTDAPWKIDGNTISLD